MQYIEYNFDNTKYDLLIKEGQRDYSAEYDSLTIYYTRGLRNDIPLLKLNKLELRLLVFNLLNDADKIINILDSDKAHYDPDQVEIFKLDLDITSHDYYHFTANKNQLRYYVKKIVMVILKLKNTFPML